MKTTTTTDQSLSPNANRRRSPSSTRKVVAFDREQLAREKKLAILIEAARWIRNHGYKNVALSEVADRLGIAKPAIYYYFKNKEEILIECFNHSFKISEGAWQAANKTAGCGRDKVEAYMRFYLLSHMDDGAIAVPFQDSKSLGPAQRARVDRRRRFRRDRLRALVQLGIADGSITPCDPRVIVGAWSGAVGWIIESFNPAGELAATDVINDFIRLFFGGLERRPPSARPGRPQTFMDEIHDKT